MDGLDFSSLRPVGGEQPDAAPVAAPASSLDFSKLRPASEGVTPQTTEQGDDLLGQAGAGLVKGIPNAITGLIGAQERGRKMGLVEPLSQTLAGFVEPVIDSAFHRQPIETTTDKTIQSGLSAAHLNPNDYFRPPATPGERIAEMAGEGAITSIMPGGQETGWARLGQIAKELFAGTAAGAGSQAAVEAAPEDWKGAAGLAGGLAGGIGGAFLAEAPGAAAWAAGHGVDYLKPIAARDATDLAPEAAAETTTGQLAAKKLGAIATDPAAAAEALRTAPEYVPGSKPTAFQASGDVGLGSFERALARGDDKFKAALLDRVDQQNAARVSTLNDIESTGDIGGAVQFFRDRMRTLEQHADTLYDRADKAAKGQYDALGDRSAGDVGEQARMAIAGRFKDMNGETSALWNSIDPNHDLHVATQPLVQATAKIYGAMSPEEKLNLAPYEKNIAGIIGGYGDTLPFDRFKDLRSAITTGMRDAKSFANPNGQAYRRLSMLRDSVEQAVEQSVSQKFEADPSLAEQFVKQARDWYANRTADAEASPLAATGTEGGAGAGASPAAGASGENGTPRSEPAGPPRDQGLPQDAARAAPEPAPAPVVEAPALQPRPREEPLPPGGAIQALDPREIGVDARRFQFKEGGDERGVTDRLQGVERWDPRLAGTSLVYRDTAGKDWIADGHQRMGLAKRLIDNGHPPFKVNAFVLDAKDGITDADARAIAAVKNIAEGTGTPIDAAKVLRAAKETGVDLPPLPPRSALVRDGEALAALSPEAFGMVINEVVPAAQGAIVGRMIKDPAAQEEAVRVLAKLKPDNARMAEMVVRDLINSGVEQMTKQGGLFGEEAFASSVVLERAKIADQALKLLKQDKKLFGTLVDEAERIEGAGNALNRDANATRLSTDEKANDLLTQLAFRAGPVSTELTRLARSLKAGDQTPHAAARDFLQAIRRAVESGVDTGDSAGGAGSRAAGEEAPLERDPNTKEMFQSAPPVASPAFKRWFGDSKVVDESGAPLVVHHGTAANIDAFTGTPFFTERRQAAEWFASDRDGFAWDPIKNPDRAGHVVDVYLSITNPLDARTEAGTRAFIDLARRSGANLKFEDGPYGWNFESADISKHSPYEGSNINDLMYVPAVREQMAKEGYDGLQAWDVLEQGEHPIWVPIDPTQIKSVNNRGTFDPKDPRILYQNKPKPWREGDMLGGFNTERGLEGLPQAVIPGTEVTDASRLQMAASKPLKGGEAPPPRGGLFDVQGREEEAKQGSLFQSSTGAPIRDTMAERFAAAGRPPEEAVAAGELVNAFYTTMADRLGKPVDELVEQHPLPQVRKGEDPEAQLFQPAYHGTPHIFDKFDSSKIGTGEGAQAFGHGLYFAGRKGVAEHYRDTLSKQKRAGTPAHGIVDGERVTKAGVNSLYKAGRFGAAVHSLLRKIEPDLIAGRKAKVDAAIDDRLAYLRRVSDERATRADEYDAHPPVASTYTANQLRDMADVDRDIIKQIEEFRSRIDFKEAQPGGRLYHVDIPHDDELLSWDKPLSEQPQAVKDKFSDDFSSFSGEKLGLYPGATGKQFYEALAQRKGSPEAASAALRDAGIPGHRFLDQVSRNPKALADAKGSLAVWEKALEKTPNDAYIKGEVEARRKDVADIEAKLSHNYVIYDDKRVNILNHEQPARGSIQFGDTGSIISMFKGADASTALHESGHHFLKMFKSMAEGPDAPASIAADWRAAKAWWDKNANDVAKDGGEGVTPADVRKVLRDGTTGDRMKDLAVDRGLHEQWARGLETYLRDGKAPNGALRAIFQQFKDWLTNIYRNAGDLGVKMSPEIRDVFDRMLATDKSRGPKMLDEGAAQRFSSATAATREIKNTFGAKPVKAILHRPGATYPYTMPDANVAANLFKPGPEGGASIQNALKAGAPKDAVEAAAVLSLKKAATKDGAIDPAKLAAWRQKHTEALGELPELDGRLQGAAQASEALSDIAARRKDALDQIERSAVGKLLKVQDDADVSAVLGRMLGKDTAVRDMRSLAAEARRNPDAMAGLRRGLVEHMLGRMRTPKDALRADTFQRFLGKNAPALSQVLTPEQMNSLHAIALDMKRAAKEVRAPGGGSDTAENLAAKGNYGLERPSILGQLFRNALTSGAVGIAAHLAQGPIMGAISAAGSFLGGSVVQAFRQAGIRRVDDLIREAVLDPELMRALLLKAPKRGNAGSSVTLRERLGRLAANNLAISAARDGNTQAAGG